MTERPTAWSEIRTELCRKEPTLYELEPGGALGLTLDDDWIMELTPDGRLICQTGMDMEDIQSLLSDGTPEELGTDELAGLTDLDNGAALVEKIRWGGVDGDLFTAGGWLELDSFSSTR